jgi:hypothetical protein
VLVGFDFSKGGHPAQPNSILYNPEQFAIGVLLHLGRCLIRSARIHPATGVSGCVAVEAMTRCAFGAEEYVSLFDAGLQPSTCSTRQMGAAWRRSAVAAESEAPKALNGAHRWPLKLERHLTMPHGPGMIARRTRA